MKLGIIVATAFWTAIAVWGFWGFAGFCATAAAVGYIVNRKQERN